MKTLMKKYFIFGILLLPLLLACTQKQLASKRTAYAKANKGDILIAAAWPWASHWKALGQGMDLAVSELNQAQWLGERKLKLVKANDDSKITTGQLISHRFANNVKIPAVIGHIDSYISLPATSVYQYAGMLVLTPGTTARKLTQHGFKRLFRLVPNDQQMAEYLARYAKRMHYKNIVIYYVRNLYGRSLANYFEGAAEQHGLHIVDRKSYLPDVGGNITIPTEWRILHQFDAIFLAGVLPEAAEVIKKLRQAQINVPVFGADGLAGADLIRVAGRDAEGVVVLSFFDPQAVSTRAQAFVRAFKQKYGHMPDTSAALGYDSVMLLAKAIKQTGSTDPEALAAYLHGAKHWEGVTGAHTFDERGDLLAPNLKLLLFRMENGKFKRLP